MKNKLTLSLLLLIMTSKAQKENYEVARMGDLWQRLERMGRPLASADTFYGDSEVHIFRISDSLIYVLPSPSFTPLPYGENYPGFVFFDTTLFSKYLANGLPVPENFILLEEQTRDAMKSSSDFFATQLERYNQLFKKSKLSTDVPTVEELHNILLNIKKLQKQPHFHLLVGFYSCLFFKRLILENGGEVISRKKLTAYSYYYELIYKKETLEIPFTHIISHYDLPGNFRHIVCSLFTHIRDKEVLLGERNPFL
jgi:hypothetical protein